MVAGPPVAAERKWSRATAGESPPQRATRLDAHREHQARQKQRHLARLDRLLQNAHKKLAEPLPCGELPQGTAHPSVLILYDLLFPFPKASRSLP